MTSLLLASALSLPVNNLQLCATYEDSFLSSAAAYEDTKSCYDLEYSILSLKQLILSHCPLDPDYTKISYYLVNTYNANCKKDKP